MDLERDTGIEDQLVCPICLDNFVTPKLLPCLHTFCFDCLQNYAKKSPSFPSPTLPCPLCKTKFDSENLSNLTSNLYYEWIEVLKNIKEKSKEISFCSICNKIDRTLINEANDYCVECSDYLCTDCLRYHAINKVLSRHNVVKVTSEFESLPRKFTCQVHLDKDLDFFCKVCRETLCYVCFVSKHRDHETCEIKQCVDYIEETLETSLKAVQANYEKTKSLYKSKLKEASDYEGKRQLVARRYRQKADEMKSWIDEQLLNFDQHLSELRTIYDKEIDIFDSDRELNDIKFEGFINYSRRLLSRKDVVLLACNFKDLMTRSKYLSSVVPPSIVDFPVRDVDFCPNHEYRKKKSTVGYLKLTNSGTKETLYAFKINKLTLIKNILLDRACFSLATVKSDLYISIVQPDKIVKYNINTASQVSSFPVHSPVLYMIIVDGILFATCVDKCILKIRLPNEEANVDWKLLTSWDTSDDNVTLSLTAANNLLACCRNQQVLKEYTTEGLQLREIVSNKLKDKNWYHAVQLNGDRFVIAANRKLHLIDDAGNLFTSLSIEPESREPLDVSRCLIYLSLDVEKQLIYVGFREGINLLILDSNLNLFHSIDLQKRFLSRFIIGYEERLLFLLKSDYTELEIFALDAVTSGIKGLE